MKPSPGPTPKVEITEVKSHNRLPGSEQGGASSSANAAINKGLGPTLEVPVAEILSENKVPGSEQGGASSSGDTAAITDHEFRNRLRKVLVGANLSRDSFMGESDKYPRFAWQNVLLSFKFWQATTDELDKGNGPSLELKLSEIVQEYPDILQRELLQDGLQLLKTQNRSDSYGALHAAVLWDSCTPPSGTKLVNLLMEPDTNARAKIFEKLGQPTQPDSVSDSFHLMRRAVLWRYMQSSIDKYTKVATLMRNIEMARKKHMVRLSEDLKSLISKTHFEHINLLDMSPDVYNPDPWVVVLAWASVSDSAKEDSFILKEFKNKPGDFIKRILTTLKAHSKPSKFVDVLENSAEYVTENIVQLLVTGTIPNRDEQERPNGDEEGISPDRNHSMEKCFLDRFYERTPEWRGTPLHFAAFRGNVETVRALIDSCDKCLKIFPDQREKIVESLYDARHMTPLHYAVLGNTKDVVMALMDWEIFKPHVDDCDIFMRSAFQIACCSPERRDIAQHLYDRNVDMDKENCCSFTALHWAIYSGSEDIAKLLIQRGVTLAKGGVAVVSIIREYAKKDIKQSLLGLSSINRELDRLYQDRQVFVQAANAILVGAALIASVTFAGFLAPPWGHDHDSLAIHVFWAFSSLSFFFSIATVMSGACTVLPYSHSDGNMKYAVESLRKWLLVTSSLLILSVALVLGAFAAAGFSSLLGFPHLRTNMIITTSIGSCVCVTIGIHFCKGLVSLNRPLWLDQTFKEIFKLLEVKEMQREIKSLLQDLAARLCPTIFRRGSSPLLVDSGTGSRDLKTVLESFQHIAGSAPRPTGNSKDEAHREHKLRRYWRTFHRKEGTKPSCRVRNCYLLLESNCSDDLLKLTGIETASMSQFKEMWSSSGNT